MSKNWEEHVGHLRNLFGELREAGHTCKRKKCSFGRRRLEFLGHEVGDGVISVPAARVRAIKDHPLPKTRKQLRAFLGLVGYYRRFIAGCHRWSALLTPHTSTRSSGQVSWTEPMLRAFRALCNESCESVCLYVPCDGDMFVLESDASSTGVGAVLSVERDGERLPVAFFFKTAAGNADPLQCPRIGGACGIRGDQAFLVLLVWEEVSCDHRPQRTVVIEIWEARKQTHLQLVTEAM